MRKLMLILLLIWMQNLQAQVEFPPFVRLEKAHLVFPGDSSALRRFHAKTSDLMEGKQQRINILHIGGSHVQAGFLTQGIRLQLTDWLDNLTDYRAGRGDRGMLFPYRALKTNAPQDYTIQASGEWTGQRNLVKEPLHPMGLAGAYVATADSASLHIMLDSLWSFEKLRIYGTTLTDSITSGETLTVATLPAQYSPATPAYFAILTADNSGVAHYGKASASLDPSIETGNVLITAKANISTGSTIYGSVTWRVA